MIRTTLLVFLLAAPAAAQEIETIFDSGFFTEGPAAAPDGSILFSDITASARSKEAGHIWRYDPRTGAVAVFRSPSGMANGLAFDRDGRLVAAEGADRGGRRVTRTDMKSGRSEVLADSYGGKRLNSPNDLAIDTNGRIYFTDPRYVGKESIEQPMEAVYRIDPDGTLHRIITDAGKPNGIAVSPDQKTLYVASTDPDAAIFAYTLSADGTVSERRVFFDFPAGEYADGLTVDRTGNVYCGCGPAGARVFSPAGDEIARYATPGAATNVELAHGEDALYITAGRGLYRVRLSR
ncbi:MAG TPA: SMP-30/gluconolactonase/LRE family protein [Thermoanaerobaculia bacterium]|nr:SMP-30/gluconolactonase/LRE family protein [Thermoanaerobaculia bacterium]